MATFLTTAKMDPALVARIEASLSGRRKKPRGALLAPRLVSIARIGALVVVAALVYSALGVRRHEKQELARTRSALLDDVRGRAASLAAGDLGAAARDEAWLARFSRSYDGEVIAPELRAPGALTATLARPLVYVRGPIGAFSSARAIAEAAASSSKDALLLCLVEPPASRAEKDLLARVRIAYGPGPAVEQRTPHARRLWEAEAGLPVLSPAWAERVQSAPDVAELAKLRRELERAPVAAAKAAARAELLLVAMDEPGEGGAELDGERRHWVRLGLVELGAGRDERMLLSLRKLVDPSWISLAKRSEWAAGIDGCGLAFDVHELVHTR